MKVLKISAFALIFFLNSLYGYGQQVKGQVLDVNGVPLIGATIMVEGYTVGTATDSHGKFEIAIASEHKQIKISSIGFEPASVPVSRFEEGELLIIQLREGLYQLPEVIVERNMLTGGSANIAAIPGSAHYLNYRQLNKFSYTDANRVLRNVPGLNIQEEDGFGLRPNIGMRGTGVERSSKISIMEDGILMAPAPYTAPSAYYFPSMGRMQGVEVRKGSSQIKYGPYTTGGAINFLSTAIPSEFSSRVSIFGGNFGRRTVHAMVGQSFDYGGFMLETFQNNSTGFKVLDNGGPTGFSNQDYLAKVRINTPAGAKVYQSLTFKIGQADSNSDETYLGLTRADFEIDPLRRYYGSQLDNIITTHNQYVVTYSALPFKFMDVSLTGYRNDFSRNWYKLDKVKYDANAPVGISDILDDPIMYVNEYSIITGTSSPNTDALFVKANNRSYYSKGIQLVTGLNFNTGVVDHDIEASVRIHRDEEDRFQWQDFYQMENGTMKLTTAGIPGTESNRVSYAKATAAYLQYTLQFNHWRFLPGLRYENITISRIDYGKSDPSRVGTNLATSSNSTEVWIPGASLEYTFSKQLHGFAGVHKGFAPPGPTDGTLPENSINYETGFRFSRAGLNIQSVGFYNDYSNLLGADLAASGGGGTGDLFNAGKARIYGIEAEVNGQLPIGLQKLAFPLSLAYTYTNGNFLSSFDATNEDWGQVENGDQLPYLATHQVTLNAGIEHPNFNAQISSKYNSAMRTVPGTGEIPPANRIDSNYVIDFSANYRLTNNLTAFGSVNNLTGAVYVVSDRPAGLRPGMPRSFLLGLKMNF